MLARFDIKHLIYYGICEESASEYIELETEMEKLCQTHGIIEGKIFASEEDAQKHQELRYEIGLEEKSLTLEKLKLKTAVFASLSLEAAIYDYAATHLGDNYATKYLDKLDVPAKWIVIPLLVTGKEISRERQGYELLKSLVSFRNKLVHHKSKALSYDSINTKEFWENQRKIMEAEAKMAINSLRAIWFLHKEMELLGGGKFFSPYIFIESTTREIPINLKFIKSEAKVYANNLSK